MVDHSTDGSDERTFLHDLASPIGTALFLVDAILDSMQAKKTADPSDIEQMKNVCNALDRVKKLLEDRRAVLIKRGVPSARA